MSLWNVRFVSLIFLSSFILLYIIRNFPLPQFTDPNNYVGKIEILKRERDTHLRRLQIYMWKLQIARNDREILSGRLNRLTMEFNQLKCDLHKNVTETGAWCRWPFENKHFTDTQMAGYLAKMLEGRTVGSFGEGPGHYRRYLLDSGLVTRYDAYDGSPYIENATNFEVKYLDLTIPHYGLPIYDWVLSIEVAEHVPKEYEEIYLNNLVRHAKWGLILSWAIPKQSGYGHSNPRLAEYVESKLRRLCFEKNQNSTNQLRRWAGLIWLKRNLNVFERTPNCSVAIEDA